MSRYDNIIASLENVLRGIRITLYADNGYVTPGYVDTVYRTDAGDNVWLNLEYQTTPPVRPCVILYPEDVTDSLDGSIQPSLGEQNHFLSIKIEGFIDDTERGEQGQQLRQDILRQLNQDRTLGNLTEGIEGQITSSNAVEPAGDGGFLSFVSIAFTIFYVTLTGEI